MAEAIVVVVDNSEWMRNGDYVPTRMQAERDAVLLLTDAKTQANAENSVAIISAAGDVPRVHVALTSDLGKLRNAIANISVGGKLSFGSSLSIAQLALKNRMNKNQKQRIMALVGSPVFEEEAELVKLAKKLQKNNVAVDVVLFAEHDASASKLRAFVDAVNKADNSHMEVFQPGETNLADMLLMSSMVGMGGGMGDMGYLEANDPELALAIRLSREEQERRTASTTEGGASTGAAAPSGGQTQAQAMDVDTGAGQQGASDFPANFDSMTEEEQLEWALRKSMEANDEQHPPSGGNNNQG